jgi:hypothetical protein
MIVYPDFLPRPMLKDLKYEQVDNVLRTKMVSGYTRSRQIALNPPTMKQVIYRVHKSKATVFEGFIKHALHDASLSFLDLVHTPLGLVQHQIKFLENPLANRKPLSRLYWQYDAKVEIEDFATMSAIDTMNALIYPNTYEELVNSCDMSSYYTENAQ